MKTVLGHQKFPSASPARHVWVTPLKADVADEISVSEDEAVVNQNDGTGVKLANSSHQMYENELNIFEIYR